MLAHRLLRLFLVTGVCSQSGLRSIMAWRSHGRDNADMVRHLKGVCCGIQDVNQTHVVNFSASIIIHFVLN